MTYRDANRRWRTESLFVEVNRREDTYPSVFCLNPDNETDSLPSFKRLYLDCSDPTEYLVGTEVLGSWKHWVKLSKCAWFQPYLREWRSELEVKLRSEGIAAQRRLSAKGNVNASKWLAEKGWDKRRAGTPSSEEVARERKVQAANTETLEEDFARVFGDTQH